MVTVISAFFVALVISLRTIAIWRKNKWVMVLMGVLTLAQMTIFTGFTVNRADVRSLQTNCLLIISENHLRDVPWLFGSSIVFDSVAIILTTYKLRCYHLMGNEGSLADPPLRFWKKILGLDCKMKGPGSSNPTMARSQLNAKGFSPLIWTLTMNGFKYFIVATIFNFTCMIYCLHDRASNEGEFSWSICSPHVLI